MDAIRSFANRFSEPPKGVTSNLTKVLTAPSFQITTDPTTVKDTVLEAIEWQEDLTVLCKLSKDADAAGRYQARKAKVSISLSLSLSLSLSFSLSFSLSLFSHFVYSCLSFSCLLHPSLREVTTHKGERAFVYV